MFPFGQGMIDLADHGGHFYLYALPILAAWTVLGATVAALSLAQIGYDHYRRPPVVEEEPAS